MTKLFIIGNGFDIAHKIPSSYEDFHQYLINTYPDSTEDDSIISFDYLDSMDDNYAVSVIRYFLSEAEEVNNYCLNQKPNIEDEDTVEEGKSECKWSTIESSLGDLDLSKIVDLYEYDEEADEEWKDNAIIEDLLTSYCDCLQRTPEFFEEWITNIEITKGLNFKSNFNSLIDGSSLFLNFNYTTTLEEIYNVSPSMICHIHGNASKNTELIFGHNHEYEFDSPSLYGNSISTIAAEDLTVTFFNSLLKPTNKIIDRCNLFFTNLIDVKEIYSYGFSYGSVDMVYIEKIIKCIPNTIDSIWYFDDFRKHNIDDYIKKINKAGFNGKFAIFHP